MFLNDYFTPPLIILDKILTALQPNKRKYETNCRLLKYSSNGERPFFYLLHLSIGGRPDCRRASGYLMMFELDEGSILQRKLYSFYPTRSVTSICGLSSFWQLTALWPELPVSYEPINQSRLFLTYKGVRLLNAAEGRRLNQIVHITFDENTRLQRDWCFQEKSKEVLKYTKVSWQKDGKPYIKFRTT